MNKQQFLVPVELNANLIVKEFKKKYIPTVIFTFLFFSSDSSHHSLCLNAHI